MEQAVERGAGVFVLQDYAGDNGEMITWFEYTTLEEAIKNLKKHEEDKNEETIGRCRAEADGNECG